MLTHRESRFLTAKKLPYRGGLFSLVVGGFQREFAEAFEQRLQFKGCAACAESGGLVALVELGAGIFLERSREFFDLIK